MSPVDEHVVSFLVAWAGFKTIRHLVSVEEEHWNSLPLILSRSGFKTIQHLVSVIIHVHCSLCSRWAQFDLSQEADQQGKSAQITVLKGNCGDHKIIFTTFRDVGKSEQVKSKHHHSFLFLCKEKQPPLSFTRILYQNINIIILVIDYIRLYSLAECFGRWLGGVMRRSWRRWFPASGEFGDLGGEPVSVCMLIKENLRWVFLFWLRLYFCYLNFTLPLFSFASQSFAGTFGSSTWVWPSSECAE